MHPPELIPRRCSRFIVIPCLLFAIAPAVGWCADPAGTAADQRGWQRHTIDDSLEGADGARLADFDGDGLNDIVTGWEESGVVRLYLNPGPAAARSAWPQVTLHPTASPEDAVPIDLDGDGDLDVVSCHEGKTRRVMVSWNQTANAGRQQLLNATNWKSQPWPQLNGTQWMYAAPISVSNSTAPDPVARSTIGLAVGSKGPKASISLLIPPSGDSPKTKRDLTAWRVMRLRDAGWIMSLVTIDMDGDGDLDLLYSDRKGANRGVGWLECPADPINAWADHAICGDDAEVMFLHASHDRILVATRGSEWFDCRRNGNQWITTTHPNPTSIPWGKSIAPLPDGSIIYTANTRDGSPGKPRPGIWSRNPAGQWSAIGDRTAVKFDQIVLADLSGDGHLDVVTCEERQQLGVVWYENPAD